MFLSLGSDMESAKDDGGLPPLPAPDRVMWQYGKQINHYTEDQMRKYAKAALDAVEDELEAELKKLIDAGLGQIAKEES